MKITLSWFEQMHWYGKLKMRLFGPFCTYELSLLTATRNLQLIQSDASTNKATRNCYDIINFFYDTINCISYITYAMHVKLKWTCTNKQKMAGIVFTETILFCRWQNGDMCNKNNDYFIICNTACGLHNLRSNIAHLFGKQTRCGY